MPGLDDIDEDDFSTTAAPTTATAAPPQATTVTTRSSSSGGGGLTMDDIFGGLGEAPKPKAKPAAAVAPVQASPSPPPAAVSTSPKPPGGDLDDFFSAPPVAAAQKAAAQPAKKKPASDDLLGGGGRGGATLSEAANQDGIYVPPPGVLSFMSHYEVLSLREASATPEAVSKAYKKLAIAFHPDKRGKEMTPEEDMFFKAVTTAHEVLADADKRAEYDAARRAAKTAAGPKEDLFAHFA